MTKLFSVWPIKNGIGRKIVKNRGTKMSGHDWPAALNMSIEKWETVVEAYDKGTDGEFIVEGTDSDTCALCWVDTRNPCRGCPVSEDSGFDGCKGTSYYRHLNAGTIEEARQHAQDMVEYLKGLRS